MLSVSFIVGDFDPMATQLCITDANVGSSISRTIKVMRSGVAGKPVVDSNWLKSCVEAQDIVTPSPDLVLHSIKGNDSGLIELLQRSQNPHLDAVLSDVAVFVAGMQDDLASLLAEAGATVLSEFPRRQTAVDVQEQTQASLFIIVGDENFSLTSKFFHGE